MCRLLGVSASGFYEWLGRSPSARSLANARLLIRIREFFALSQRTYGSPRIWKDLVVAGERCGEKPLVSLHGPMPPQPSSAKAEAALFQTTGFDEARYCFVGSDAEGELYWANICANLARFPLLTPQRSANDRPARTGR